MFQAIINCICEVLQQIHKETHSQNQQSGAPTLADPFTVMIEIFTPNNEKWKSKGKSTLGWSELMFSGSTGFLFPDQC